MIEGLMFLDFGSAIVNNLIALIILMVVTAISSMTYKYIELAGKS